MECPTGSGRWMNLDEVAKELSRRLVGSLALDNTGHRPGTRPQLRTAVVPDCRNRLLFYE